MPGEVSNSSRHRLYLPVLATTEDPAGSAITLDRAQTHYLVRVLRLKQGAALSVFDGAGREWRARVDTPGRSEASLAIGGLSREAPTAPPLVLVQAWLKGSAVDTTVQKATELGATAIWLIAAERSNVPRLTGSRLAGKLAHLTRIAGSASEQSGRLHVPGLEVLDTLTEALDQAAQLECRLLVLDLDCPPLAVSTEREPLALIVGPEGGWSETERRLFEQTSDVRRMGLGALTLRAETAPLAALAAIRHSWGWR